MRITHVMKFLSTNGDGTGTIDATGDYSVTADDFYYEVPAETKVKLTGLGVTIRDGAQFNLGGYGALGALTNGIQVIVYDSAEDTEVIMAGGESIHTNTDWGAICVRADTASKTGGGGEEVWFIKMVCGTDEHPIILEEGDRLIIRLNDSFIGLDDHKFFMQGVLM